MKTALLLLGLAALGVLAWIRLAPSDPERWHVLTGPPGDLDTWALYPPGTDPVTEGADGARATVTLSDTPAEAALARLDAIATASPRTRRLAGSPETGMMTWVTRSAVFGFPDYTTAATRSEGGLTFVALHARQRFGTKDFGVNAARLRAWLAALSP